MADGWVVRVVIRQFSPPPGGGVERCVVAAEARRGLRVDVERSVWLQDRRERRQRPITAINLISVHERSAGGQIERAVVVRIDIAG